MADFARWGYAIGEALGEGLGQIFLKEYTGNRRIQNEEAIANDPVATLIVEFMKNRWEWIGLYSALYKNLADMAENCGVNVKHKSFPANAISLSKRITAIKSNLENVGINCEPERRTKLGQNLSNVSTGMPELWEESSEHRCWPCRNSKSMSRWGLSD